jgi:cyclophilin family peptidyl-prolyl cis-trans isomerase/HEAT repeat protein
MPLSLRYAVPVVLLLAPPALAAQQPRGPDRTALQRILVAEDARGHGSDGLAPLLDALQSPDTLLRRVAVRGLGRLQRPELGLRLVASLADTAPAIRAEAANGVAQSLKRVRRGAAADSGQLAVAGAARALADALAAERDADAAAVMAQSLGRLLFGDSTAARSAERAVRTRVAAAPSYGAVHGLYTLALARRLTGTLSSESVALLRTLARTARAAPVRRLAVLTLAVAGGLDSATTMAASADADEQVRRLALRGARSLGPEARGALVRRAFADPGVIVRVDAVAAARAGTAVPDCRGIIAATGDRHPYVALTAIDSLGAPCADSAAAVRTLVRIIRRRRTGLSDHAWQAPAHALRALAHVAPGSAAPLAARAAASPRWQERVSAARSAAITDDRPLLFRLAGDGNANVREAAVIGLSRRVQHAADTTYLAVLRSTGHQAVLAAAEALAGTPDTATVLPAVLAALDRLTAERSENARDPRLALLGRIGELGSAATVPRLERYVADFDTTVATTAAGLISKWTGRAVEARPGPLPIRSEPLAAVFRAKDVRFRVTMAKASGGGTFVVRLFTDEAPATAAHLVRLARAGYYDGLDLHRVEPNFVVQGGGPGDTEYIGDTVFMRDELGLRTHARGTLGISSRGRDTGDAQWFINLADNPLLDHEYTVFGEIVTGRTVAERILEGDRIARVEVLGAP